ncbi:MAG: arsenical resistance operon transcriptional repressor ArsD [Anaerolineaceae bacterium]|nr:arsenical resistance operon transcriptional repressor ArsD [Anaerolineaceae bacterium]
MNGNVTFFDAPTSSQPMSGDVEFFDPPMCCPTGLCGPTLDQTLLDVNEMVIKLKDAETELERYQMISHPNAFMQNAEVMRLVRERQMDALPITIIRGQVIKVGAYPTLEEVQEALNKE